MCWRTGKPKTFLQRFNGDVYGWLAPLTGALDDHQKQTLDGMYDAEVAYQDAMLGKFFDRLKQSGRLDNTLVIICADHGEHLGEKQFMGHSLSIYNELIRVPLIIRDPSNQFQKGTTVDTVVSTRRLFHTVLAAAEIANEKELELNLANSTQNAREQDYVFAEAIPPQNVVNLMQKRQPELVKTKGCDSRPPRRVDGSPQADRDRRCRRRTLRRAGRPHRSPRPQRHPAGKCGSAAWTASRLLPTVRMCSSARPAPPVPPTTTTPKYAAV